MLEGGVASALVRPGVELRSHANCRTRLVYQLPQKYERWLAPLYSTAELPVSPFAWDQHYKGINTLHRTGSQLVVWP